MNPQGFPSLPTLIRVERELGAALPDHCFVGGVCSGFYVRDLAITELRTTTDVDLVVEVVTLTERYSLESRLREQGLENDPTLTCRWRFEELVLDIMPTVENSMGFSNRWYPEVLRTCEAMDIDGVQLRYPNVWAFLATKIEAFNDRGGGRLCGE